MPDAYFPATYSLLSASALLTYAQDHYALGDALECHLLDRGLNDTYLIRTSAGPYVVRVYRMGWRSLADIGYELDLLLHLQGKGVPVSSPLPRKDGNLISTVQTLEGPRPVVLFTFAEGERPRWPSDDTYCRAYGQAVARIHGALDDFTSQHPRFRLDLEHLLESPVRTLLPLLDDRPEDQEYLLQLVRVIQHRLDDLPSGELEWGACHGDFHGGNARVTSDLQVIFFDFDCCGPGWRAYDLAVFRFTRVLKHEEPLWEGFLAGYLQQRTLQALDLGAVPVFMALRQIWRLGVQVSNAPHWGSDFLNKRYFESNMQVLRELGAALA